MLSSACGAWNRTRRMRPRSPWLVSTAPSGAMLTFGLLGPERDRPGLAEDRVAVARDELPLRVDLEGAVAGVALAGGRLHGEEAVALDRGVERVARHLDRRRWRNRAAYRCR